MPQNKHVSAAALSAQADAFGALFNSGYLRFYDGAQPAGADTAISGQNKLAELRFASTAFASAVAGVISANAITADHDADATGTATWFRCFKSDGTTALLDGSVGSSGCDINLNDPTIQVHAEVGIASFAYAVTG